MGSLEDMVVVAFLHEETGEVVLAVEDSIESSVGRVSQGTTSVGAPEAGLVVTFSLHCHLTGMSFKD